MMRPEHAQWAADLIKECQKPGLTVDEWWTIGEQMHTIDGDYRWVYKDEWNAAYPEMKAMWDIWEQAKPEAKGDNHENAR